MIKGKIVESIRGYLLGREPNQDSNGLVSYQRIVVACDEAFETMLNAVYDDNYKSIESNYVKNFENKTLQRLNGKNYLDIDDTYVGLPNGLGVWYVKPRGGTYALPKGGVHHNSFINNLPIGDIVHNSTYKIGYVPNVDGKKILIEHIGDSIYANTTRWDYGLVRQFSAYDDEEDILIPHGRYDQFINQVLQWFGKRQIDNSNNNAE